MPEDLERRARMHAALGEPLRLAIIDQLALGDAAPGELSTRFGVPTNLLAHHLRRLDAAGLIRRLRSEGDHRRGYVQLRLDDPAVASLAGPAGSGGSGTIGSARRVVFVCTHNSARSQLAAAAWRQVSQLPAASAGTHPATQVHPLALAAGRRHGLPMTDARTAHVAQVVHEGEDLVVAVCDSAHEELHPTPRRLHWSVPDPVRIGTDAAFEVAYAEIARRVRRLASAVPDAAARER
ncbi:MAG: helix-turn-helix domain-containing protein [Actinobacteria bacterium]|nr:helix-turn-helix domain-containing protein [Actinomycetota bacterium]MBI3686520.1 helix-turn-helix domain-containing protein [Actinomycetota bacterium]